jgi:hypothetical protein
MSNCQICNGRGFSYDKNGKLALCVCTRHGNWAEYLNPLKNMVNDHGEDRIKFSRLSNCNQVITNTDENMAALMNIILSNWYPEDYLITTIEELNAICFQRHDVFKSLYEFISAYKYFIVDMSIMNPVRAKSPEWIKNDSMCLLDFAKMIIPTHQKIVIIINSRIERFRKQYPDLCNGLYDFGIEYFHTGSYRKFSLSDNQEGTINE